MASSTAVLIGDIQYMWLWASFFRFTSTFTHFSPSLKECCELDIEYIMAVWCWEAACNKHWTQFFLSQKEISLGDQEMVWKCRLWDSLLHSLMYILTAHWRDRKRWHLSCQSQEKMVRPMLCERNIWHFSYWWNHWHWSTAMDNVENVYLSSVYICVVRKSGGHPCL